MGWFKKRKEEEKVFSRLERSARKAWIDSPKYLEDQQRMKEESYKRYGPGAFAYRQSDQSQFPDDDKFPELIS